jgi:hypothetical protein
MFDSLCNPTVLAGTPATSMPRSIACANENVTKSATECGHTVCIDTQPRCNRTTFGHSQTYMYAEPSTPEGGSEGRTFGKAMFSESSSGAGFSFSCFRGPRMHGCLRLPPPSFPPFPPMPTAPDRLRRWSPTVGPPGHETGPELTSRDMSPTKTHSRASPTQLEGFVTPVGTPKNNLFAYCRWISLLSGSCSGLVYEYRKAVKPQCLRYAIHVPVCEEGRPLRGKS